MNHKFVRRNHRERKLIFAPRRGWRHRWSNAFSICNIIGKHTHANTHTFIYDFAKSNVSLFYSLINLCRLSAFDIRDEKAVGLGVTYCHITARSSDNSVELIPDSIMKNFCNAKSSKITYTSLKGSYLQVFTHIRKMQHYNCMINWCKNSIYKVNKLTVVFDDILFIILLKIDYIYRIL